MFIYLNIQSEPVQAYAYPEYSHVGCFWDEPVSVFQFNASLVDQRSGLDTIAICQKLAVKFDSHYYAIRNGTTCMYGIVDVNELTKWASPICNSNCGLTVESRGLNCGGEWSNSVYRLGVI